MKAKEIMIPKNTVKTIKPNEKIATAKLRMSRNNIGGLPVVDGENKVIGFITLRDINIPTVSGKLHVNEIMTKEVLTKKPDTEVKEITEIMEKTGLQRIPIVNDEEKLIGLITQTSVIKAFNNIIQ